MPSSQRLEELPMTKTELSPAGSEPVWKDPLFWFVIAVGLGYGGVRNFLPTTFPILRHELGATLEQLGKTEFLFYLSSVLIGVLGGSVLGLFGLKRTAATALGLAGVSLLLIGPAALGLWIVHAERWHLTWRSGYFAGAALLGTLVLWALLMPDKNIGDPPPERTPRGNNVAHMKLVLRDSAFRTAVLLCFCHGLAQAGMVAFVGQLYIRKVHVDLAHAAYLLSAEGAGIVAGRLIFAWITSLWSIPE